MLAEIRHREGVIIIRPTGRMIGAANVEIRQQIHEELEEHFDSPKVIFNLEEVTRMDSSGLGTLVSVHVTITRKGGRTALVNAGAHIRNLLVLGRLATVFENYDSEEEAILELNADKQLTCITVFLLCSVKTEYSAYTCNFITIERN